MCVQNFSYFNGNFLPGVFPGPQVFVAFTADIPEARKGPDSFNKPFSVHYTNELQCPMGFVASLYDAGIELQSILAIGSDAMRYVSLRHVLQFTIHATRRYAIQCDSMRRVMYIVNQPLLSQLNAYQVFRRVFQPFQPFQ